MQIRGHTKPSPPDEIMQVLHEYAEDKRARKINTGIGMILDVKSRRPFVPSVVRAIGRQLTFSDVSYLPSVGHTGYLESHARHMVFGNKLWSHISQGRRGKPKSIVWAQTLGGTGALALSRSVLLSSLPKGKRVLLLDPGWSNHTKIFRGFTIKTYVHENPKTRDYNHSLYTEKLKKHPRGSAVLLQVCGYNDDGTERDPKQWEEIVDIVKTRNHRVVLDFAYNGLVDGWGIDNYPIRLFTKARTQALICVSNSKNVAYNARLGSLYIVNLKSAQAAIMQSAIANTIIRPRYSNPPALPAQVMAHILADTTLRKKYMQEIDDVRVKLLEFNRNALADVLGPDFEWIRAKRGLFFKLLPQGFSDKQITLLREKYAIHGPRSSRINLGGLPPDKIEVIGKVYKKVLEM